MQDIAENLNNLKGVISATLIIDEDDFVTTLGDDEAPMLVAAAEMINEYFSAIQSVEKSYREIFFSVSDGYWVAFQEDILQEEKELPLILLKIEKKVNWPLISMGVKAAVVKLKKQIQAAQEPEVIDSDVIDSGVIDESTSETVELSVTSSPAEKVSVDFEESPQESEPESIQKPPEPDTTFTESLPLVSIVGAENDTSVEKTEPVSVNPEVIEKPATSPVEKAAPEKKELLYRGQKLIVEKTAKREEEKKPGLAKSLFSWGSKKQEKETTPESPVPTVESSTSIGSTIKVTSAEGINALQKQLSEELVNFLGPAATFVFDDAVQKWRETYVQKSINLGYLVEIVMEELDTEDEKQAYRQAAIKILNT